VPDFLLFMPKDVPFKQEKGMTNMENIDVKFLDSVLERHGFDKTNIIGIMQDVQEKYRYLPQAALSYIAKKVGMSESKIYGVATFYGNFSLDAKGKYVLKVCRGTACHVRKSANILARLYEVTGTSERKATSDDGLFSIEIVSCLGACGLSPVVMVNDTVHAAMTPEKAEDLIRTLREEA
jgi:NADH-quinone oxidoreductase subunit E